MNSGWNLRKLETFEHDSTREIWEKVFREDTKDFLDYYYSNVANKNDIYVLQMHHRTVSMLHLNPYQLSIDGRKYNCHYIVAVATLEEHRKQGIMRNVLTKALTDMFDKKEVFTYLMPAAEAIYSPYNFVTVYEQPHYSYEGEGTFLECYTKELSKINFMSGNFISGNYNSEYTASYIEERDLEQLAEFARRLLGSKYDTFTIHDEEYIRRLIKEQASQNGKIVIVRNRNEIVGYFYTAHEDMELIREYVIDENHEQVYNIFEELQINNRVKIKDKTKIMVRPVHMEGFLNIYSREKKLGEKIQIVDEIIEGNTGTYEVKLIETKLKYVKVSDEIRAEKLCTIEELVETLLKPRKLLLNEIV